MNANSKKEDYGQFHMLNVSMTTIYVYYLTGGETLLVPIWSD